MSPAARGDRQRSAAVHEVAEQGFSSVVADYERARPSYPPEAVAWLVENLRIGPSSTVADVAAGTGKLTRLLRHATDRLVAIEPVAAMRDELARQCPRVRVMAATAECLPFADESLHAVTVAQAFHWFDADAALDELHRAVNPGGRIGLVWNVRDRSVAWVDRLWSIMDRVEKRAPWRDHDNWRESFPTHPGFTELVTEEFWHEHALPRADVLARFASVSHVAVLPDRERERVLREVAEVLDSDPETRGRNRLAVPYRVDAMYFVRTR